MRGRKELRRVAERADDAVLDALDRLGVSDDDRVAYLQAHLTRMPGWAAHVQWCAGRDEGIDVLDYLAMRLTYEAVLLDGSHRPAAIPPSPSSPPAFRRPGSVPLYWPRWWVWARSTDAEIAAAARVLTALPVTAREVLWQNAFEAHYRDGLLEDLSRPQRPAGTAPVHTQLVSCIDTRSEGLRRHLESLGGYETLGFAGFFAVAIRYTDVLGGVPSDLCPVLISPNHDIAERPAAAGRRGTSPGRSPGPPRWPVPNRPSTRPRRRSRRPSPWPRRPVGRQRPCRRPRR